MDSIFDLSESLMTALFFELERTLENIAYVENEMGASFRFLPTMDDASNRKKYKK